MPTAAPHHAKALAWVKSNIGKTEVPPGSNRGPFVQKCQAATSLPGTGWPWCVATWIAAWKYGARVVLPYLGASAYGALDWYQANLPKWVVPRSMWGDAKPGAGVVFNIGSGHLGTLAKPILPGDTTVTTIDGNTSDQVAQRVRSLTLVRGIIDPPEAVAKTIVTPPRKSKVFEVATSESGQRKVVYVSGPTAIGKKIAQILNRRGGVTITPRRP